MGSVIRQVQNAYRLDDGAYVGGRQGYTVRVEDDAFAVTPVHVPGGVPLGERAEELGGAPKPQVADDGHLELVREPVVEHLRNSKEGVEQSWAFADKPAGAGNLVVEVEVEGQHYVGVTDGGLHFVDPDTGVGVRYGHATWIDADGEETSLLATWTGEAIELRVPEAVVDQSSYPAVLDPVMRDRYLNGHQASGPADGRLRRHQLPGRLAGPALRKF